MRRLTAIAAILLAAGALLTVPTAGATAVFQRGGQNEARTLTGRVVDDREQPLQKAIVYLKNTKNLAIKLTSANRMAVSGFQGLPRILTMKSMRSMKAREVTPRRSAVSTVADRPTST